MIAATTPPTALTLPVIALVAKQQVKASVAPFPGATYKIVRCRKSSATQGSCSFYVVGHFNSVNLRRCDGFLDVRNIGHGIEHRFRVTGCKAV